MSISLNTNQNNYFFKIYKTKKKIPIFTVNSFHNLNNAATLADPVPASGRKTYAMTRTDSNPCIFPIPFFSLLCFNLCMFPICTCGLEARIRGESEEYDNADGRIVEDIFFYFLFLINIFSHFLHFFIHFFIPFYPPSLSLKI